MSELVFNKQDIINVEQSGLQFLDYVLLKIIYDKAERYFNLIIKDKDDIYIAGLLSPLQKAEYIKIISRDLRSLDSIMLRDKSNKLFAKSDSNVKEILEHLNNLLQLKRGFSYRTASYKSLINARINDGYSVQEIKDVITFKHSKWKNTDMEKYLRPDTLFNTGKFQGYYTEWELANKKAINSNTTIAK